ncbi:hypothetical protein TNCV_3237731 [Trichonephila clavipes]|nr:hypothetical protein TNCV_3237731 [Trichonephila clavipes]
MVMVMNSCRVRALVPQKFSVEEELMHVKHVEVKSPHVGVMWKFVRGVISSGPPAVLTGEGIKLPCVFEAVREIYRNIFGFASKEKVDRFRSEIQLAGHPLRGLRKTPAKLDCPIGSSEEYIEVEDDNVCIALIMADKDILEFDLRSKNIINADSDNENEMDDEDPVPTSFKMGREGHKKYAQ